MGKVIVALDAGFSQTPVLSSGAQVEDDARAITRLTTLMPGILVGASTTSRPFKDGTPEPSTSAALGRIAPSSIVTKSFGRFSKNT